jgi:hypothetical protein
LRAPFALSHQCKWTVANSRINFGYLIWAPRQVWRDAVRRKQRAVISDRSFFTVGEGKLRRVRHKLIDN